MGLHGNSIQGYPFHRNTGKKLQTCGVCGDRFYGGMGRSDTLVGISLCRRHNPSSEDRALVEGRFSILELKENWPVGQFETLLDVKYGNDWMAARARREAFVREICGGA